MEQINPQEITKYLQREITGYIVSINVETLVGVIKSNDGINTTYTPFTTNEDFLKSIFEAMGGFVVIAEIGPFGHLLAIKW